MTINSQQFQELSYSPEQNPAVSCKIFMQTFCGYEKLQKVSASLISACFIFTRTSGCPFEWHKIPLG
jgi:hypothetical protein